MIASASDFHLSLPARAENVAVVRHAMRSYVAQFDVPEMALNDILLAVTEACTNSVVHAYPSAAGVIDVGGDRDGDSVVITVRDYGAGIKPRVDSPGLGLGLPVIMALSESTSIGPAEGGGTEVSMTFDLRHRPEHAAS